ncbi:flagellin [Haloimpatiens sp. FM7330]|uniref:flagellin N-terminal helical domain-containing protein n=1 Tax=Haloimpatiens sp. FM7330 TaxID=3298610 RepID=UPI003632A4D5
MRLMHNLASLNIFRNYTKTLQRQSGAIGKISSGYKVNSASESPNDLAKSERMRIQIRGLNMASRNAQDGVSMLQTAEGGLENMTSMLTRMRELAVRYGNDTNTDNDKKIIETELSQLVEGYDEICNNTEFNGVNLLNTDKELEMPVGSNVGETVKFNTYKLDSTSIKDKNGDVINLNDLSKISEKSISAGEAIEKIDKAMTTVVSVRSKYGAIENRFEGVMNKLNEIGERVQGAESQVRDVDIAEEMMNFSRDNILVEASNAMMVQSNKFPQDILRILENVKSR